MALYDAVDELPAALAAAVGSERFGTINTAFERLRPGFDRDDWMSDNRGWLARGMVNGEIDAVRLWLAMATQVAELVAGLPSFARSTSCPSRTGYLDDLTGVFRAPPVAVNPMAAKLLEARRNQRPSATAGTTVTPEGVRLSATEDGDEVPDLAVPEVEIGDPMAELEALVGLAPVKEQVKRLVAELKAEKLRTEAGHAALGEVPAHDLHRQPRHREDHRGPAPGPDLRPARRARATATSSRSAAPTWSASTSARPRPAPRPGSTRRRAACCSSTRPTRWCRRTRSATSATRRSRRCSS